MAFRLLKNMGEGVDPRYGVMGDVPAVAASASTEIPVYVDERTSQFGTAELKQVQFVVGNAAIAAVANAPVITIKRYTKAGVLVGTVATLTSALLGGAAAFSTVTLAVSPSVLLNPGDVLTVALANTVGTPVAVAQGMINIEIDRN